MEPRPRPPVVKPAFYETPEQFPTIRIDKEEQLKHPKNEADTAVLHRTKKSTRDGSQMFTANEQKREQWRHILVSSN